MDTNIPKTPGVKLARVSSKEQEETGYSLDAQDDSLDAYAEKTGIDIRKGYRIAESAAGKQKRKIFNQMMVYVRRNGIRVIIVETTDRLTRNFSDVTGIDAWLLNDERNQIHLVKEGCVLHKNSKSHEWFIWRMKVAVAEFYVRLLSEKVKAGQETKIKHGWLPTKPPLGYKTTGEKGHKIHVIDKPVAKYIRFMFERYATGDYSISRLVDKLYKEGLRTRAGNKISTSKTHVLLTDPFYYGKIRWNGTLYPGKHEPLISKRLFDTVQRKLQRPIKTPYFSKHNPVFKGKIRCIGCGGLVTWYLKKGHYYGHCYNHGNSRHCPHKTCMRQERVEEQLFPTFDLIAPKNKDVLAEIQAGLKEQEAQISQDCKDDIPRLEKLLISVRNKKDKYYEAKINKDAPAEYCDRKINELTNEEDALTASLKVTSDQEGEYGELRELLHLLAFQAKDIYQNGTTEERQLLIKILFANLKQDRRKIVHEYTAASQYLMYWMPRLNRDYEPHKNGRKQRRNGEIRPQNPELVTTSQNQNYELKNTLIKQGKNGKIESFYSDYQTLLRWRDELRNLDWQKIFPCPEASLQMLRQLLRLQ